MFQKLINIIFAIFGPLILYWLAPTAGATAGADDQELFHITDNSICHKNFFKKQFIASNVRELYSET